MKTGPICCGTFCCTWLKGVIGAGTIGADIIDIDIGLGFGTGAGTDMGIGIGLGFGSDEATDMGTGRGTIGNGTLLVMSGR